MAIAFVITLNFGNYKLSLKTFNEFEPVGSALVLECLTNLVKGHTLEADEFIELILTRERI